MVELLTLLLILVLIVALPFLLSKGARMFRTQKGGGGGNLSGALLELDRITRPSVENVEKMEDHVDEKGTNDGD